MQRAPTLYLLPNEDILSYKIVQITASAARRSGAVD